MVAGGPGGLRETDRYTCTASWDFKHSTTMKRKKDKNISCDTVAFRPT